MLVGLRHEASPEVVVGEDPDRDLGADSLDDLAAFAAVGRERSFTKAAAKFGVSQSALSQTITQLEARLGVRLLTRTTRSVAPTEAGQRLLRMLRPALADIEAGLASLGELRDKPSGSLRNTVTYLPFSVTGFFLFGSVMVMEYVPWVKPRSFDAATSTREAEN